MRAGASALRARLPRHVPRGAQVALDGLLDLRRYGAAMRRLLALEDARREGPRAPAARSQGMDYAESRLYTPGDDVRRIDWRVTARTGRAHTKLYRSERGRDLYCLADQRAPMRFGTRAAFKSVAAAEVAALVGWAAAEGANRFGALIAGVRDGHVRTAPAESSAAALCRALAAQTAAQDAPLDALAGQAAEEAAPGTRFVVVSDFADPAATLCAAVKRLRARGELVLIWVFDPLEERLPPPARYPLTDGREHLVLDTAQAGVRAAHAREFAARRAWLAHCAAQGGTRCHLLRTGEDLFGALERPASTGAQR